MIERTECISCGGTLSVYGVAGLYKCDFCGKLYADNKEITPLQAARDLRAKGNDRAARLILREEANKEQEVPVILRELIRMELDTPSISDHIEKNLADIRKIKQLEMSEWYRRLRGCSSEGMKSFTGDIDRLVDARYEKEDLAESVEFYKNKSEEKIQFGNELAGGIEALAIVIFLAVFFMLPYSVGMVAMPDHDAGDVWRLIVVAAILLFCVYLIVGSFTKHLWCFKKHKEAAKREAEARKEAYAQEKAKYDDLVREIDELLGRIKTFEAATFGTEEGE